jgi:hypothetical protein
MPSFICVTKCVTINNMTIELQYCYSVECNICFCPNNLNKFSGGSKTYLCLRTSTNSSCQACTKIGLRCVKIIHDLLHANKVNQLCYKWECLYVANYNYPVINEDFNLLICSYLSSCNLARPM